MKISNNNAFLMVMGTGSRIEIHAADAEKDSWTQISTTAQAGTRVLQLSEDTGWEVGDKIAIASTGVDMDEAEERSIVKVSADGKTITLDAALEHAHYGEIDTYENGLSGAAFQSWDLDMRAEVALLSRNVTIQGDAESASDGYGGHTMVMNGAAMHIDGVEFTQMGQAGIVGRYALHWHMSGDASGQYITNSSIHDTYNKGMTIHGTQNTWIENNAIYDTIGHSYYLEDGSEFGNVLKGNLGMNTNAAESVAAAAIGSDHTAVSTFWITNPNNHLIGNHAAGSDEAGFWILSQDHVEGLSATSGLYDDYVPRAQTPGQWIGNTSHSNHEDGIFVGRQFDESTGEAAPGIDPKLIEPYALTDFTTYKNGGIGVWVRNGMGDYSDLKIADSKRALQSWGAALVEDSLIVGASENSEGAPRGGHHGWELYDNATHFDGVHFEGFSGELDAALGNGSGFSRSTNYSVDGVTFGDDVPEDQRFVGKTGRATNDGISDKGGSLAGAVHDTDGSISGIAGAYITPAVMDVNPNQYADILNRAYTGVSASGFNASEGAVWLPDSNAWLHAPDTQIGLMAFLQSADADERTPFTIMRTDNGARIYYGTDTQESNNRGQLNVDASGGFEYIVTYPDGIPDEISMELRELRLGDSVIYRFQGLPDGVVLQGATQVANYSALTSATETSWFQAANGSYVVKAYADRENTFSPPRSNTEGVRDEIYTDRFKLVIADRATATPSDNQKPRTVEENTWSPATPNAIPDRAESTSDTVTFTEFDSRWSEAAAWSGGVPGADDIVIIGPGQRIILDQNTTAKAILVNGGELVVEDTQDIALSADWVLVINGGIFQVGTEDNPFEHDFDLTLEGDDRSNDIDVMALTNSTAANVVRAINSTPAAPPVAVRDTVAAGYNETLLIDVLANDTDANGAALELLDVSYSGMSAQVSIQDGKVLVNPLVAATQSRVETINYTVQNADGVVSEGELLVEIGAIRDSASDLDVIFGTETGDRLVGGTGIDRMLGGTGIDTFVFRQGTDLDIIYDYVDGTDKIGLDGIAFADLQISAHRGSDTLIQAGDDRIILRDVDYTDLTRSDFIETPFA